MRASPKHLITAPLLAALVLAPLWLAAQTARQTPARDALSGLDAIGAAPRARQEFLHPDQAFVLSGEQRPGGELVAHWAIAPGYYLYRDKIRFSTSAPGVTLDAPVFPEATIKQDPYFGEVAIYKTEAEASLTVRGAEASGSYEIAVTYQGCAEDGICYPPIKKTLLFNAAYQTASVVPGAGLGAPRAAEPTALNEVDRVTNRLHEQGFWLVLAWFYGAGLLLSFSPCVFPMIPILSGIVVGQGSAMRTPRAFGLSAVYVVSMAAAYALLGMVAGLFGHNLQATFQHPAILIAFAGVFVVLALAMFGLYQLELPAAVTNWFDRLSRSRKGGTLAGVAAMGFLSAAIVGPCVAAPLAGALTYVSHAGNPYLGAAALFVLGIGMGTPLLIIGTSAGALLPAAGRWMQYVQYAFGVVMLGVAIWFLSRVIPPPVALALWGLLCLGMAVYLGAFDALDAQAPGWRRLGKGVGLATVCYGAVLLVGAAAGADDVWQPLKPLVAARSGGLASQARALFKPVRSVADLDGELAQAQAAGKPVLLDFYADWCTECVQMERRTFVDAGIQARLAEFTLLRADVTANDADHQALLKRFDLFGPPATIFFDWAGVERRELRLNRFEGPKAFAARLANLRSP
jgi:thiol:disulfide interchange protein DsbD